MKYANEIREYVLVPDHVHACASAIRYDLLYGPAWAKIPDGGIEFFTVDDFASDPEDETWIECYTSIVADTLREFIDNLPDTLYVEEWCGYATDREPEGDEPYYAFDKSYIVEVLFGKTIARGFR